MEFFKNSDSYGFLGLPNFLVLRCQKDTGNETKIVWRTQWKPTYVGHCISSWLCMVFSCSCCVYILICYSAWHAMASWSVLPSSLHLGPSGICLACVVKKFDKSALALSFVNRWFRTSVHENIHASCIYWCFIHLEAKEERMYVQMTVLLLPLIHPVLVAAHFSN